MEQLNRRIVLLAQITSAAAIFTILVALAVALHWGPSWVLTRRLHL
jgi:hypothetical protein